MVWSPCVSCTCLSVSFFFSQSLSPYSLCSHSFCLSLSLSLSLFLSVLILSRFSLSLSALILSVSLSLCSHFLCLFPQHPLVYYVRISMEPIRLSLMSVLGSSACLLSFFSSEVPQAVLYSAVLIVPLASPACSEALHHHQQGVAVVVAVSHLHCHYPEKGFLVRLEPAIEFDRLQLVHCLQELQHCYMERLEPALDFDHCLQELHHC
ncbi:hypothetical protein EGW08_016847 [Elysia chlorotica]|uniref:Uncharacterized protein n=1 Tax=Elysia chlorotica TaxID=188477 RepID=A0A3S0ZI47_ELYCH|nr:hypothetical protein EGW08_016847 [Elysia chlorotica]